MLKYNGFYVWFGTIFRDSVTYFKNKINTSKYFPDYDIIDTLADL